MRARAEIEERAAVSASVRRHEISLSVNKSAILERIAALVRDGRLDMISDLRGRIDRRGWQSPSSKKRQAQPRTV